MSAYKIISSTAVSSDAADAKRQHQARFGFIDDSDSDTESRSSNSSYDSDDDVVIGLHSSPNKLSSLFVESLVNELPGSCNISPNHTTRSTYLIDRNKNVRDRLSGGFLIDTSLATLRRNPGGGSSGTAGEVHALDNTDATLSIAEKETAMEEQLLEASRLKRQELRSVLIERSRSLQASERCREEELRQEAEIRREYEVAVAKLLYNLDLHGKSEQEIQKAVEEARSRGVADIPLSSDVLESYVRRKVNVKLSDTGAELQQDVQDIWEALGSICDQVTSLLKAFPQLPTPAAAVADTSLQTKLLASKEQVDDLSVSLTTTPCFRRLLLGNHETLRKGEAFVRQYSALLESMAMAEAQAAEAEKLRAEAELRAQQVAEAKELAILQRSSAYKERERNRGRVSCCYFQMPYVREKEKETARVHVSLKAKADRCGELVRKACEDASSSTGQQTETGHRFVHINTQLNEILGSLVAIRTSPQRPAGDVGDSKSTGTGRVCAHEYSGFVLSICEQVDRLINQVANAAPIEGLSVSTGDMITWILYCIVDAGIVKNIIDHTEKETTAAAVSSVILSETETQMCYTYSYVVYGIYKLMGDNLKKLFGQMVQCLLHVSTTALTPNFSQWVDADITALVKMIQSPIDPALLTSTKQNLLRKSSKLMTFHGSLIRFKMNNVASSTEAFVWFVHATQQLLLLLNLDHISSNAMMAAVIVEHCCHVLKQFCYVSVEILLENPKLRIRFIEYGQKLVSTLSNTVTNLNTAVSAKGGGDGGDASAVLVGSVTMIGKCVDMLVQGALSKVLALDLAVLTRYSSSNFTYSAGPSHVLMSYGLISSVKKFESLVARLDTSPTAQEQHLITEVIKADQLDGSIMNQLGPSAASQTRVLNGITETLARSMGEGLGEEMLEYTLFKVAHVAVKQSATPFFLAAKHAVPLARVVCSLCQSNPMICDLVIAQFYLNCPLALPNVLDCDWKIALLLTIPIASGAPELLPRESAGYITACRCLLANRFDAIVPKDTNCGNGIGGDNKLPALRFETRDKYMTRMIKIFSTFCYIMVQPEATPLGPKDAWHWLSNFIKDCLRFKGTLPFMVASTLDTFLRITAPTLYTHSACGSTLFLTTLSVIKDTLCEKLDLSTGRLKIEAKRLEEFVQCALDAAGPHGTGTPVFKEL